MHRRWRRRANVDHRQAPWQSSWAADPAALERDVRSACRRIRSGCIDDAASGHALPGGGAADASHPLLVDQIGVAPTT